MPSPEIVFIVDFLFRHFCDIAFIISLHKGRFSQILQRFDNNWSSHASLHILQFTTNACARHYGGRTFAAESAALVGHDFHGFQSHVVRPHQIIPRDKSFAAKPRTVFHVRSVELVRVCFVLLAFARN